MRASPIGPVCNNLFDPGYIECALDRQMGRGLRAQKLTIGRSVSKVDRRKDQIYALMPLRRGVPKCEASAKMRIRGLNLGDTAGRANSPPLTGRTTTL